MPAPARNVADESGGKLRGNRVISIREFHVTRSNFMYW